jgi:hypothetical protein
VISDQIGFDGGANNSDPACDAIDHGKDYVLELDTWRHLASMPPSMFLLTIIRYIVEPESLKQHMSDPLQETKTRGETPN